jgi:hypothetical protein
MVAHCSVLYQVDNTLITYIIAPPSDPHDLDSPVLLIKVYPEQEEPMFTTPPEWEALIRTLSDEHCKRVEG